jgi:hypothetical protein
MYLILSKEKYAQCNTLLFTFKEQTEGRKGGKRKKRIGKRKIKLLTLNKFEEKCSSICLYGCVVSQIQFSFLS